MALTFDEQTHTYTLDGVVLPSVTQICKPLTVDIAENARPWLRDKAAERGTLVHELCAAIDFDGVYTGVQASQIASKYVEAYIKFIRDYKITDWLAVERMLYEPELGFAGTIDRVGIIDGVTTIVDIKTGAKIDKAMLTAQLHGYAMLWSTLGDVPLRLWGLQLKSNGDYRIIKCEPSPVFNCLLDLYKERSRINAGK